MSDLKPCPFCGAPAGYSLNTNSGHTSIDCQRYRLNFVIDHPSIAQNTAPDKSTVESITAGWNSRPVEDALQAEVDRYQKLILAAWKNRNAVGAAQ